MAESLGKLTLMRLLRGCQADLAPSRASEDRLSTADTHLLQSSTDGAEHLLRATVTDRTSRQPTAESLGRLSDATAQRLSS